MISTRTKVVSQRIGVEDGRWINRVMRLWNPRQNRGVEITTRLANSSAGWSGLWIYSVVISDATSYVGETRHSATRVKRAVSGIFGGQGDGRLLIQREAVDTRIFVQDGVVNVIKDERKARWNSYGCDLGNKHLYLWRGRLTSKNLDAKHVFLYVG
jgi:hypothetical protein